MTCLNHTAPCDWEMGSTPDSKPLETTSMTEIPDPPNADWFPIARTDHECFGCGQQNPIGLRLRFAPDDVGVKASFTPGPELQRFHDVVNGGLSPPSSTKRWPGLLPRRGSGQ